MTRAPECEAAPLSTTAECHDSAAARTARQQDRRNQHEEPVPPDLAVAARHNEIAEEASDWIWETDTDHCLTFLSKRFGESSGMPWSQVNGRPLSDLVELGFAAAGMAELRATADARDSFRGVVNRVDLAGGVTRFWSLSGRPRFDPATRLFLGYRGTGTDVTASIEREAAMKAAVLRAEAAEREALRSRNTLADAIEAIPEGFVLHDADDRLVLCNKRYGEIYGLTAEMMTPGVRYEDLLRSACHTISDVAEGLDTEQWVADRLREHRNPAGGRMQQRLTGGRWFQVVERRTSDGGIVGIRIDVTEARRQEALERERERTNAELRAARLMQAGLLPSGWLQQEIAAKTGLDIASRSASCKELGGDLWGLRDLDRGRVGVYTLDVAGHGTTAALDAFRLHTLIQELGAWLLEPARFLKELNVRLSWILRPGTFATMFYGIVDLGWNCITYAAAGSPPPAIRSGGGVPLAALDSSGVPLGITVSADYSCSNTTFGPGGMLVLYSDILTDNTSKDGDRAGEDGAFALIQCCIGEPTAEAVVERICAPLLDPSGKALSDDLTVVCIRRP